MLRYWHLLNRGVSAPSVAPSDTVSEYLFRKNDIAFSLMRCVGSGVWQTCSTGNPDTGRRSMNLRAIGMFGFSLTVLMMPVLSNAQGVVSGGSTPENRITILYDAFGKDASMRKLLCSFSLGKPFATSSSPKAPCEPIASFCK